MEFKFRITGGGPSNYHPPPPHSSSSNLSYFAEQAIRVGYMRPNLARMGDNFPNSRYLPENVLREIEKQKIREEMIAAEVERRHQLEAEVRREMMIEREMAMQSRHPHDFPFFSGPPKMPMNSRLPMLNYHENRFGDALPFSRKSEVRITELKASPEANKERIIILPRPQGIISGIKRKEITPTATNAMPLSDPNKKTKQTLRCELCHINATSEQALKEHYHGRKHKSKEARQSTQVAGKNFSIGLFSKETINSTNKLTEITKDESLEKSGEEQKDDAAVQKSEDSKDVKNDEVANTKKDSLKFAFWCEMCKIGAFSKKVMNSHMRGKKHTAMLLEDLGCKNKNVSKTRVEKEVSEAKPDGEELEKAWVENDEKNENEKRQDTDDVADAMADDVAVGNVSERAVAPLLLGWTG